MHSYLCFASPQIQHHVADLLSELVNLFFVPAHRPYQRAQVFAVLLLRHSAINYEFSKTSSRVPASPRGHFRISTQLCWLKPSWFLLAEEDRMINPSTQRFRANRMGAHLRSEHADQIRTSTERYRGPRALVFRWVCQHRFGFAAQNAWRS